MTGESSRHEPLPGDHSIPPTDEFAVESEEVVPSVFELDGERFASVEAFALVIQLPEEDARRATFALLNRTEARTEKAVLRAGGWGRPDHVHWRGQRIQTGSKEQQDLMHRAVCAFNSSNPNWNQIRPRKASLPRPPQPKRRRRCLPETSDLLANIGVDAGIELSNFAETPFELDGRSFASVEAFVQYIKYPDGDPYKEEIPPLSGKYAKRRGKRANREIESLSYMQQGRFEGIYVYWQGHRIPYRPDAHLQLIERALNQKFETCASARRQLLATGQRKLSTILAFPNRRTHLFAPKTSAGF